MKSVYLGISRVRAAWTAYREADIRGTRGTFALIFVPNRSIVHQKCSPRFIMCTLMMIIFFFPLVCVHAFRRCNATFAEGETLFSVAPKYNVDWMLLWSLNGGDSPDTISPGAPYRFAHQYVIQEGDTLSSIAHNLATTPEAIMKLNFNRITHFATERQLLPGTVICVLPSFIDVRCLFSPSQRCSISLDLPC
jgi:hypothetical protein